MIKNLGRISVINQGEYSPSREYENLDIVTYGIVGIFMCKKPCKGVAPIDADHWDMMFAYSLPERPSLCNVAALTGVDNKIQMDGIVPQLGLEVGDVIRVAQSGTAMDGVLYSVELISNDDEIIVNYEHCGGRGNGVLKLVDFSGELEFSRISKWYNAPLGLGQAWVMVSARRARNTNYTNNTGRTIQIATFGQIGVNTAGDTRVFVNGISMSGVSEGTGQQFRKYASCMCNIPNLCIYQIRAQIGSISELR